MTDLIKPEILKGTRDFLPEEKAKRDYVMNKIRGIFESFGYDTIETPVIEYAKTLLGKYGDEGSKLVYSFEDNGGRNIALRYDQTVPFARLVAQYNQELPMPFKRYQISRVWRADKPGKGRYREFYQCDIDLIGTTSLMADAEVATVMNRVLSGLGFQNFEIQFNSRRLMNQIFSELSIGEKTVPDVLRIMDKIEKIGAEEVRKELRLFLDESIVDRLLDVLLMTGSNAEKLEQLSAFDTTEVQRFLETAAAYGVPEGALVFNLSLARGLDYYTGIIFEAVLTDVEIGSVAGGGRYDNLCAMFTKQEISGTGVAFGFDRLVLAMDELGLLDSVKLNAQVMVMNFEETLSESLELVQELQAAGVNTEVYMESAKLSKQMKYADKKQVPFVVIYGENERDSEMVTVKMMKSGKQIEVPRAQIAAYFTGFDFAQL